MGNSKGKSKDQRVPLKPDHGFLFPHIHTISKADGDVCHKESVVIYKACVGFVLLHLSTLVCHAAFFADRHLQAVFLLAY